MFFINWRSLCDFQGSKLSKSKEKHYKTKDFYKRIISTKQEGLEIMEHMIKMKKKLHDELFNHNEIFLSSDHLPEKNPFPNFTDIFHEGEVPYLSRRVTRAKSTYLRASQIALDFSEKIHNHNDSVPKKQNFMRNSIFEKGIPNENIRKYHSEPPKSDRSTKKQKLIQPNLNAYLEFVDKKWKEMKKNKVEREDKKEILGAFFSERRNHKIMFNGNKTQKNKVEKDISSLHLSHRKIVLKLMESKKNDEGFKDYTPFQISERSFQRRKKFLSVHKMRSTKNFEFYDESGFKKAEMMDTVLAGKKIHI